MNSKGFGFCGLACDYCQDNPNCVGCKQGGCPEKDSCKNYLCCTSKNYKYCFECPSFPCDDSILHKLRIRTFCKYIQIYGEEDLTQKLKENYNNGIKYHYKNKHIGDYDQLETEEKIIEFIKTGDFTMINVNMQNLNRNTMQYLIDNISVGISLKDVKDLCERYMLENGADSFWYWNVGAFVFSGDETTVSISGKRYQVADKIIADNDIITVDLSPQNNNYWGDYARTIIIENGKVVNNINDIQNQEWKNGLLMEKYLHEKLLEIATIEMTFEELYFIMNDIIKEKGFINLDFLGNLGHSIVNDQKDRIYIEKGNKTKLSEVKMFTFEPHISISNSKYGYKREDIYYFKDNKLTKL